MEKEKTTQSSRQIEAQQRQKRVEHNISLGSQRIGAHLKQLRVKRKISQEDAADEFGVGYKTWQRYEQGECLPPTELLLQLHDKWKADIEWLLFDTSFVLYDKRSPRSKNVLDTPRFGPKSKK